LLNKSAEKKGYALIGKIVGVHGVKGTHKIRSYAESLEIFKSGSSILIRNNRELETICEINWVKPHTGVPLLSLKGVTGRHQAESMVGSDLFIKKSELPQLEEGTYYWFDLIGIDVYTTQEEYLGRIASIVKTGSNDVYVVNNGEKEILIPALETVVLDIDLGKKQMRVDLPEGLI
jgi:16S rRNA processing protein RimM